MSDQYTLASITIDFWVQAGIRDVFIGPGSRSSPLVLAAVQHSKLKTTVIVDERTLAFCALGLAKYTNRPSLIITTSGSALLNTLPAVLEASMMLIPLVIISADRPKKLHNVGANQTFNQKEAMCSLVRFCAHLECPDLKVGDLERPLKEAYRHLLGKKPGPIHLNIAFDEPLYEPSHIGLIHQCPFKASLSASGPSQTLEIKHIKAFKAYISSAKRPLIMVGNTHLKAFDYVTLFKTKIPVVADCQAPHWKQGILAHMSDWLLELNPDCVIQIGSRFICKAYEQLKVKAGITWLYLSFFEDSSNIGHTNTLELHISQDDLETLFNLDRPFSDPTWLKLCKQKERDAFKKQADFRDKHPQSEDQFVYTVLDIIPQDWSLFVSNSLLARQVDQNYSFKLAKESIFFNRGVSGIDGTTATAAGVSFMNPCVLLTGDLSFLYDLHVLKVISEKQLPLVIVIMNNKGGRIFEKLNIAIDNPFFDVYFKASHTFSFEGLAKAFLINYKSCYDFKNLELSFRQLCSRKEPAILELFPE